MNDLLVYVNGDLVPSGEAAISVLDHSFLYGDGVFEGISIDDGQIYRLEEHITRLLQSAAYLRISSPLSHAEFCDATARVVAANGMRDGYVRPILTRGTGSMGLDATRDIERPNVVIVPQVRKRLSDAERLDAGLRAKVVGVRRTPPECLDPRVKSNNYLNLVLAKFEQWDAGADVALLLDMHGFLCEGAGQNVFVVTRGVLRTPRAHAVLDGITRRSVLALQRGRGEAAVEEDLTLYDLYTADEVFVTATLTEIAAVTSVDGRPIGAGTAGPTTRELLRLLREDMDRNGYAVDYDAVVAE